MYGIGIGGMQQRQGYDPVSGGYLGSVDQWKQANQGYNVQDYGNGATGMGTMTPQQDQMAMQNYLAKNPQLAARMGQQQPQMSQPFSPPQQGGLMGGGMGFGGFGGMQQRPPMFGGGQQMGGYGQQQNPMMQMLMQRLGGGGGIGMSGYGQQQNPMMQLLMQRMGGMQQPAAQNMNPGAGRQFGGGQQNALLQLLMQRMQR